MGYYHKNTSKHCLFFISCNETKKKFFHLHISFPFMSSQFIVYLDKPSGTSYGSQSTPEKFPFPKDKSLIRITWTISFLIITGIFISFLPRWEPLFVQLPHCLVCRTYTYLLAALRIYYPQMTWQILQLPSFLLVYFLSGMGNIFFFLLRPRPRAT